MKKKEIIMTMSLIIAIVFAVVGLVYYWNTNPEPLCNRAGGFWGPVGCENLCDQAMADYDCIKQPGHMDCTCGKYKNKCWNGKECIEKN